MPGVEPWRQHQQLEQLWGNRGFHPVMLYIKCILLSIIRLMSTCNLLIEIYMYLFVCVCVIFHETRFETH